MVWTRLNHCSLAAIDPISRSEWPPIYFVRAMMLMSTPRLIAGKNKGVAQVLSIKVVTPCLRAMLQMPGHVLDLEGL